VAIEHKQQQKTDIKKLTTDAVEAKARKKEFLGAFAKIAKSDY
jgi:hypothetical protein